MTIGTRRFGLFSTLWPDLAVFSLPDSVLSTPCSPVDKSAQYAATPLYAGKNQFQDRTSSQANLEIGIGVHGPMLSMEQSTPGFNPVRDVWFPLDLSNPASFNLLIAYSASQMARLCTEASPCRMESYTDSLTYNLEAIRLLNTRIPYW